MTDKRWRSHQLLKLFTVAMMMCGVLEVSGQVERSASFHDKYRLKQVVVLSRHNIRSPLSGPESALGRITPHEWFRWSSAPSELSLRGGVLETMMGQYFRKWLVSEGLIEENEVPQEGDMRFYANSMQRTIATAQYFSSGMLPVANAAIEHHCDVGTMDPVFSPVITRDDESFRQTVMQEITSRFGNGTIAGIGEAMSAQYALLEDVLDLKQSAACQQGDTCSFKTDDSVITLTMGKEPSLKGSLSLACKAVDALVLQYYEEPDDRKAAFGHDLSLNDWQTLSTIKDYYGDVLFTSATLSTNLAHPLLKEILAELKNEQRRFAFLCGHDSNLSSVLGALGWDEYTLPSSIEKTPIGAKLVIEKWLGTDGEEYVAMNMVYQSTDQLRRMPLLSLQNPPVVFSMVLKGLAANDDGLYRLADFEQRFTERIEANGDTTSSIRSMEHSGNTTPAAVYSLQGQRLYEEAQNTGIYIKNGRKMVIR